MNAGSSNSTVCSYQVFGHGDPVVFIQGVGVPGSGWLPQTEVLSRNFKCVIFDNRGLGNTPLGEEKLSVEVMASDVLALMNELKIERAHIAGHSLGGVIAQEFALQNPSRVRSLALMCTFARGKDGARLTPWVLWKSLRTRVGTKPMRRQAFLEMLFSEEFLASQDRVALAQSLVPLMGRDLSESPAILMKQLQALGAHDASQRLFKLRGIPTLIISAKDDGIAKPKYGRQIAQMIHGSRFEVIDGAHAVTIEKPKLVNQMLHEFWSKV